MKKCYNCGIELPDDCLFCTECGKPISQDNVCPYCGASVNEGDVFCQNCGKCLYENPRSELIAYEGEQVESVFKKYIPYVFGGVLLLGIIGYFTFNELKSRNDAQSAIADTVTVDSYKAKEIIPITKEKLEKILSPLVCEFDYDLTLQKVNKLFTEGYKTYYNRACEKADKEGQERPRIWWQFSDSDPETFTIDKLEMTASDKAKALVKLSSDYYEGRFEVLLNNENGDWLIDKITELGTEYLQVAETTESENIDDVDSQNLDWLQGHWVYEQGSYKGHFIIQGDKITQYSSMNPERETSTFRIEGDELLSRIANGLDLTVKIDFANHTIDYGDGCWMHKVE